MYYVYVVISKSRGIVALILAIKQTSNSASVLVLQQKNCRQYKKVAR